MTPNQELKNLLANFKKRLDFLEKSAFNSKKNVISRDKKLASDNQSYLEQLKEIHNEIDNFEIQIKKIDSAVRHTIEIIKHLAHKTDLKNLNDGIKEMNFDELINENELKIIIEQKLNQ